MNKKTLSLPDKAWFHWHQALLLQTANTRYGRELLGITDDLPKLTLIRPNMVQARIGEVRWVSEYHTANKYGNVIRDRWKDLEEYWKVILKQDVRIAQSRAKSLGLPLPVAGSTTTIIHPDPDPEIDTVDGVVARDGVDETFAVIRAGAGTGFNDDAAVSDCPFLFNSTTSDQYQQMQRGIFLFDTSVIPDGDIIESAIFAYDNQSKLNEQTGQNAEGSRSVLVASTPASNIELADSDYGELGSVNFGEGPKQVDVVNFSYNDIALNASGLANINKTGISKFGTLYKWDFDNDETGLTWVSDAFQGTRYFFSDFVGTARDPKLTVIHNAAPSRNQIILV